MIADDAIRTDWRVKAAGMVFVFLVLYVLSYAPAAAYISRHTIDTKDTSLLSIGEVVYAPMIFVLKSSPAIRGIHKPYGTFWNQKLNTPKALSK